MSNKDPYATDYRASTFTLAVLGIACGVWFCYAFFGLNQILWQVAFFVALCIITFAYDNSGLRTGLFRLLFKDKVFFKWLQRENKGRYAVTEALKTITYFLLSIYIFLGEGKRLLFLWVLIVALNLIMYLRYAIKKEFFGENKIKHCWTVHKSMGLTAAVFFYHLFKMTYISLTMLLLTVALIGVFTLLLLIASRKSSISKFDISSTILILIVFFAGSVFSANHLFDYNNTQMYPAYIAFKYEKDVFFDKSPLPRQFFEITDWNGGNKHHTYQASELDYRHYKVGDEIEIRQGEGTLGGRWYEIVTYTDYVVEEQENGTQKD